MEEPEESIGSRFFAIQELLLHVLSYISPPGKGTMSSIDTNTLANLARVSRNISNAALDALWKSIDQPDTIIRLLPPDAYEVSYAADPRLYRLRRELTAGDFVAFDKYAPRIRYVDFSNSSKILRPGCELFPDIKNFRDPILPALADFRWEPSVQNGCIGALHLLSREASLPSQEFSLLMWSEIEHLAFQSDAIAHTIDAFNDPALPWIPNVKKLTLRTLHYLPAVDTAIQMLFNLEYFSCDLSVSGALLKHLAVLPRLRFLDLRSLSWTATTNVTGSSHDALFTVVEDLRISGTLDSLATLLALVSSPRLLSVRLNLKGEDPTYPTPASPSLSSVISFLPTPVPMHTSTPTPAPSPSLSTVISLLLPTSVPMRTSTTGVTHFTFVWPSNTRFSANPGAIAPLHLPLSEFRPLYACPGLQTFRVDAPLAVAVTDADVRAMAHAWPLLITLTISPTRVRREGPPGVRLYTLWALACGCPRLRTLAMEVNAGVEEGAFFSEAGRSGHAVVVDELTLYSSPCGDPLLVADFLNRAFPRLPARALHYWMGQEGKERWDVVRQALPFVE
ncbi:hypothetical protein B0H12DRAFT_850316 [Mycena haematopus]|nr:hypothetical protein B0H12DRAFT_850316 [Mycena haematopus]